MSCTDTAKYFPLFQSAGEQFCDVPRHFCFWTFCPKVKAWSVSTGPQLTGSGEAPQQAFWQAFLPPDGAKIFECVHTRIACQKRKCGYTILHP